MQPLICQSPTVQHTARKVTIERTDQADFKPGTFVRFLKRTIRNLPCSLTIGLGLIAAGSSGASGSPLPGQTTLGARNTSLAINGTNGPFNKNTTPDSITEPSATGLTTGIDDLLITTAIDEDFQFDIGPEQQTTAWLEAVTDSVTETISSDSITEPPATDTDDVRFATSTEQTTPRLQAAADLTTESARTTDTPPALSEQTPSVRLVSNCKSDLVNDLLHDFTYGRVELLVNGTWGTICRNFFTNPSARVVCRMAGLSTDNAAVLPRGSCDRGRGPILLDNVSCLGSENDITECENFIPGGATDCTHYNDVAVRCRKPVRFIPDNERTAVHRGTPQVWFNDTWANIPAHGIGSAEAGLLCHDMGFPREDATVITTGNMHCLSTTVPIIQGINCTGNETSILDCNRQAWVNSHSGNAPCPIRLNCKSNIRLSLAERMYSRMSFDIPGTVIGRVEVFDNGLWRTVKSRGFGSAEARVICRSQGYPLDQSWGTAALPSLFPSCINYMLYPERYLYSFDSIISDPPLLQVDCAGNESSLMDCRYEIDRRQQTQRLLFTGPRGVTVVDGYVYNGCDAAIVRCNSQSRFSSDHPTVALGYVSGNIKLWRNEAWGGVCNGTINDVTAGVICREIGYPAEGARVLPGSTDITGRTTIIPGNLMCSGDEKSIVDCRWVDEPEESSGTDSQCSQQVAVRCMNRFRLAPGGCVETDTYRSIFQIWYNGRWEPVCYDGFFDGNDRSAADAACYEMGYAGYAGQHSDDNRHQCSAAEESALWKIKCSGKTSRLMDCSWWVREGEQPRAVSYCKDEILELSCLLAGDQRSNGTQTASSNPAAVATTATTPAISRALTTRNTENTHITDSDTTAHSLLLKVGLPASGGVIMVSVVCFMYKKLNARKVKGVNYKNL